MSLKSVFLLVTILITCANSQEIKDNGFIIVSTTQRPSDPVVTTILEKQPEFCTKVNEESRQQFGKIQKMLEEQQKRNEGLIQKSQENDQQISEIKKTLEALQKRSEELNQKLLEIDKKIPNLPLPKNCKEVMERGNNNSGIYPIRPKYESFMVLCDMASRGGGWTVFQNRIDGSQDFYLDWEDYKRGFGNLSREFWLGLEHLHQLTGDGNNELFVTLVDYQHKEAYANYKSFGIGSEGEGFLLKLLGGYNGTAGDSLANHLGSKFSTKDRDQDNMPHDCATAHGGAWWFTGKNYCLWSNLNGEFLNGALGSGGTATGIHWYHFSKNDRSLLAAKMMVRPK